MSVCLSVSLCVCLYVCLFVFVGLSLTGDTSDGSGDESDVLYEASYHNTTSNVARATVNNSNVKRATSDRMSRV